MSNKKPLDMLPPADVIFDAEKAALLKEDAASEPYHIRSPCKVVFVMCFLPQFNNYAMM